MNSEVQEKARVSLSRSGFNFYMPDAATAHIPPRATLSADIETVSGDGAWRAVLRSGEGSNSLSRHTDPLRPQRLSVQRLRSGRRIPRQMELFGVTVCAWRIEADGSIVIDIPPPSERPAAMRKAPRTHRVPRQGVLPLAEPAPPATPHSRLGALLRELNALLKAGEVDDVKLWVEYSSAGDIEKKEFTCVSSRIRILGKIIREEHLG